MKKIVSFIMLLFILAVLVGCKGTSSSKDSEVELERMKLDKIAEAIYRVQYPAKQGEIITEDLALPTSYKDVTITWKTLNFPEIISDTGKVTRPDTCWIESRDQQGIQKFPYRI